MYGVKNGLSMGLCMRLDMGWEWTEHFGGHMAGTRLEMEQTMGMAMGLRR